MDRRQSTVSVSQESVQVRSHSQSPTRNGQERRASVRRVVNPQVSQLDAISADSSDAVNTPQNDPSKEDQLLEISIDASGDNAFMSEQQQGAISWLGSPSEYGISESAIRETLESANEENQNDTGIGPGRVRAYADQDPNTAEWRMHPKHFFILSSAGKPVYSRYGDENKLSSTMGVVQALISMYQDSDDVIRTLHAGKLTVVFLVKGPLYFVLVSRTGEPETSLREQLLWLFYQIVSITTTTQLTRIFEKHHNFDLRRLLGGTEPFLDHLCETVGTEPSFMLSAIQCIRMSPQVRQAVGNALMASRTQAKEGLLYGMLIVKDRLITILRPKRHSFHPSDLHLIFNMVNSSSSFKTVPESWMPICLPKFNDASFLHAYVSYITPSYPGPASDMCLVLVCTDRDKFFEMAECRKTIVQQLTTSGSLFLLQEAIRKGNYTVEDIGIPGLRHFIYKSKPNIQFTMPLFTEPYTHSQTRLMYLYQHVRSEMTHRSAPLKSLYMATDHESIFGWNTVGFEVYAVFGPLVTKPNAVHALNALLRWIKQNEDSLFIVNAPTF